MPKNGQVTVLLFREGDKVNVYHVLEKPDGSFSPISNDHSPLSSPEHHLHEDIAQSNARYNNNASMHISLEYIQCSQLLF